MRTAGLQIGAAERDGLPGPAITLGGQRAAGWDRDELLAWADGTDFDPDRPPVRVATIPDIADALGVDRTRVAQSYSRHSGNGLGPPPDGRLGNKRCWWPRTFETWAQGEPARGRR